MKNTHAFAMGSLAAALLISSPSLQAQTEPIPPSYVVYDTGTLGGTFAFGAGVNNLGWITGASTNALGALHATLAAPGTVIDLGTLGGSNSAVEWPVKNNHGLVVGISESAKIEPNGESFSCAAFMATHGHTCLPFLWSNGVMAPLPLLGGNNGFATGINNANVAVGWAETAQVDPSCTHPQQVLQFLAVEWGPATDEKRVLPPWAGDSTSAATAINEAGEVVGISGDCGVAVGAFSARHALRWVNGQPVKLPTLGGMGWNTPMAINNHGIIAGFSDTPGDVSGGVLTANFQAALWTPEGIINLHALPGDALGQATGINDTNQVIGTSFPPAGSPLPPRAFLWQDGKMFDLNKIVQPNAPLYLISTGDINDRGEITGQGCVMPACAVLHTFVAIRAPRESGGTEPSRDASQSTTRPIMSSDLKDSLLGQGRFMRASPQPVPAQ
jgi:probable HAF family extracellular repeat protein